MAGEMDYATWQRLLGGGVAGYGASGYGGGDDVFGSTLQGAASGAQFGGGWGALAGGALGLAGGLSSRRKRKKLKKKIEEQRAIAKRITDATLGQQEGLQRLANKQRLEGIDAATNAATVAGRRSVQAAQDAGMQQQASASQTLTDRGLGSTTVSQNLGRAIAGDTARNVAGINDLYAQRLGALQTQRGDIAARGSEALGDIAGARGQLDLGYANFWMPKYLDELGISDGGGGAGGIDPQMLQWIFSSGG